MSQIFLNHALRNLIRVFLFRVVTTKTPQLQSGVVTFIRDAYELVDCTFCFNPPPPDFNIGLTGTGHTLSILNLGVKGGTGTRIKFRRALLDRMAHKVPISQKSETLTCWKGRNPLIPKRTPHSNNYNILPFRAHNACLEAKMPWRTLDDQLPPNPLSKRVLWASGDRNNNPRALTSCEMKIAT